MALRVALISAAPVTAHGWGRYTRDLMRALAAQGLSLTLITAQHAEPDSALPVSEWRAILPPLTPAPRLLTARLLAAWPGVRRAVRGHDVVHVIAEPYALLLAGSRLPLAVTAHGTYVPLTMRRPVLGLVYRRVYRRAHLIAASSFTGAQVRTALPNARLTVIPNGVHPDRFQHPPATLPEKYGPTVLAVGQVKARKGYHVLIEAMRAVCDALPGAQALIVGDSSIEPEYTAAVHGLIAQRRLDDSVHILGRVPDEALLGWYHTADVFALPSLNAGGRFEGFGLAYLEASAAGLPVIGTRDCGAEDAILDGETGYLIPQNDPAALAERILTLLRDADLRARLGRAGTAFAATQTWDRVAERVIALYRAIAP
ncbi:MAG: glycosyltransferase family 4 protein [Anaerolineae bacterium]|nr:glycosyltransferase family 4 protein [Anaerolineae bacterium]